MNNLNKLYDCDSKNKTEDIIYEVDENLDMDKKNEPLNSIIEGDLNIAHK